MRLWWTPAVERWRWERQPLEAVRAAVERRPGDAVLRLVLARKLLGAGEAGEAAEQYQKAAALEPGDPEPLAGLGRALAAAGRDNEAFAAFQLSLARRPTAAALCGEGQLYLSHQVPEKAIPVLEQSTQRAPEDAEAWRLLAEARAAAGQWSAAETAWARLAALRPDDPALPAGRAETLVQLGRPAEAEPLLRAALRREPRSAALHALLAAALAAREPAAPFSRPAEAEFRTALQLDPRSEDAAYGLGILLLREGHSREAAPLFRDLTLRAPDSLRARYEYARALQASGQIAAADRALQEYHRRAELARQEMELRGRLTLRPNDPTLHSRLTRLLREKRGLP